MNEHKHGDAYKVGMLRRMLRSTMGHGCPIMTFLSSI